MADEELGGIVIKVKADASGAIKGMDDLRDRMDNMQSAVDQSASTMQDWATDTKASGQKAEKSLTGVSGAIKQVDQDIDQASFKDMAQDAKSNSDKASQSISGVSTSVDAVTGELKDQSSKWDSWGSNAQQGAQKVSDSTKNIVGDIDDLSDSVKNQTSDWDDLGKKASSSANKASDSIDNTTESVDNTSEEVKSQTSLWDRWTNKVASSANEAEGEINDFNKKLGDVRKNINDQVLSFAKFASGAVLGATTAGIAITKMQTQAIQELKVLADTAGLSVAEFQQMAFGAQQAGIEQDKFSDILKDVNDRLGDFNQTKAGPMADFFERVAPQVGVTYEQFKKLNSAEALQLYVSTLEKANVSQKDMTFYLEAIAGDATRLYPLLKNNGEAMSAMAEEARALGIGLSELEVAQAVELKKEFDKLSAILDTQLKKTIVELSPLLNEMLKDFIKVFSDINEEADDSLGGVFGMAQKVATGVGYIADAFHVATLGVKTLQVASNALLYPFVQLFNLVNKINAFITKKLIGGMGEIAKISSKIADFIGADDPFANIDIDSFVANAQKGVDKAEAMVQEFADEQARSVITLAEELNQMALAGFPSADIQAKFEEWVARAKKAREDMQKEINAESGETPTGVTPEPLQGELLPPELPEIPEAEGGDVIFGMGLGGLDNLEQKLSDETSLILEMLGQRQLSQHELMLMGLQEEQRMRDEAYETEMQALMDKQEKEGMLKEEFEKEKAKIDKKYRDESVKNARTAEATKKALVIGGFNDLLGTLASKSKTALKIQKAFNLAQAGMAIATGIAKANELGFPANIAEIARVVAVGAKAISSIKGAQMGSAKVPSVGGGGGSSVSSASTPAPVQQQAQNVQRNVNINLEGTGVFSADQVRELIGQINEQVGDGVSLAVGG